MAQTIVSSQPVGSKLVAIVDVTGPSTYATGGVTIDLSNYNLGGMSAVEYVSGGVSSNGTYYVHGVTPTSHIGVSSSYLLMWTLVSTGAEAGAIDLSGSTVRLLVYGY